MKLATGPVTWGVDFADAPTNPPWASVLDEIANSPLGAVELGPIGYLPEEPAALRGELGRRGLVAVGSFVFDDFHDPERSEKVLAATERAVAAIAAARGSVLVIIDRPCAERVGTAGRAEAAPRLDNSAWTAMQGTIEDAAALAREAGLSPVVHPHAGTYLEFEDEIERLLADSDVGLCLDTGHLAYAGVDPVAAIDSYGERIGHVHLKDVDGAVLASVTESGLDFWKAIDQRIFCPLGAGIVEFGPVIARLRECGYEGFMTIEQDRVPGSGAPLADLRASIDFLHAVAPR